VFCKKFIRILPVGPSCSDDNLSILLANKQLMVQNFLLLIKLIYFVQLFKCSRPNSTLSLGWHWK